MKTSLVLITLAFVTPAHAQGYDPSGSIAVQNQALQQQQIQDQINANAYQQQQINDSMQRQLNHNPACDNYPYHGC